MTERIDGHTILIGLMAYPIRHSKSPLMHNSAFEKLGLNYVYLVFDIDGDHIADGIKALRTLGMRGSNISMPNKQRVLPYLDKLDRTSQLTRSVNTIVNDHGALTGYTTDGTGFMQSLKDENLNIIGKKMVLTGAGGAGTPIAIQTALDGVSEISIFNNANDDKWENAKRNVHIINEHTNCHATLFDLKDRSSLKNEIGKCDIYCDATAVGMKPLQDQTLISDPSWFHKDMIVFDTVYAPLETKLMKVAKKAHVKHVLNGLGMMLEQGAAAFKLWTGKEMPVDYIHKILFDSESDKNES
ncbi:shikimate dehydrogenase (NADP(+)) [Philodulcilactobacillus myokoensis]|uniref:Shikimate dehydrogenase (NADP(+)) n=1 Tax=Philodulcilactobacillus myokoensis TaxID=2929573 RepID=A0A9W6B209_9LACO|nr:shikimate dehydrogenase [Philodulcilactobacillus myokoensis]GLB47492.1 shikimate dehydrogenase (NADP(+)) [Philodulcilactobacillus myokoensis]